jgi:DNA-directed RNA polymerase subunit RPC12/RpoP
MIKKRNIVFNLRFLKARLVELKHPRLTFQFAQYHQGYLYCVECGYMHPDDSGLDEGDLCPDCGQGILVKI